MGQFSVEKPVAPGSVLSGNQQAGDGAQLSCLMLPFEAVPTRHLGHAGSLIVRLSESTPSAKGDADNRLCPRQFAYSRPCRAQVGAVRVYRVARKDREFVPKLP
jgi:hypothetical protein